MELDDWDTLHNKNTMEWFMDIVNESGEQYENVQTKKYQAYKKGKPLPADDDIDVDIDDDIDLDNIDGDDELIAEVDQITGADKKKKQSVVKPK